MADVNNFSSIRIGIASPETIRKWSHGEVTKSETINYRTQKPEKDGLYCERIFGPVRDYECSCGKYKKTKAKGITCDRCGVDVVKSSVRRERMGHIELACPVTHIWYLKGVPYRISQILDVPLKELEQVVYYNKYIVTSVSNKENQDPIVYPDMGDSYARKGQEVKCKDVIDDREYLSLIDAYGKDSITAGMGGEAVKTLLAGLKLDEEAEALKAIIEDKSSQDDKKDSPAKIKAMKRLEVINAFRTSGNKPEWMVLDVLPVLPPELRPMVALDGGRFATSDLNDLYRRVIMRNNRLKKMLEGGTPDLIIRSEKRILQEAVDALIDNGRRGKAITSNNRKVKSLTEVLKGKQGRFRQNLLGKRVDFSGRSVIVVGPELKMYQCGLPKEMAIELFKPFVIKVLQEKQYCSSIKSAKRIIETPAEHPYVWDILEDVIKDHPVLLNRAPSLHRLSIQAFEPVLVEGRAIKLHPLVCTAFNADFDGDQMAVHVPLSLEARAEARFLMLSTNNILKLSDGKPVVSPSQDIVIGSYYLTIDEDERKRDPLDNKIREFRNVNEAKMAYSLKQIPLQRKIKVRVEKEIDGVKYSKKIETTVGRIIFNEAIPQDLGFIKRDPQDPLSQLDLEINMVVKKGELSKIVDKVFAKYGATETAVVLDKIKALGYKYSTVGAITANVFDMNVVDGKQEIIDEAQAKVDKIYSDLKKGAITEERKYEAVMKVWSDAKEAISNRLEATKDKYNPIWMMADSKARGGMGQISQLCGMRGIVASTSGKNVELPIKSSYSEGLSVLEYFISAHGGRKGMADTSLKTSNAGYLTRRLVDVCHHVVVYEEDCKDTKGYLAKNTDLIDLEKDLIGKVVKEDVKSSKNEVIVKAGKVLDSDDIIAIYDGGVNVVELENELTGYSINSKKLGQAFRDRIAGRFTITEVVDPKTGEIIVPGDTMISTEEAEKIEKAHLKTVVIRSVLTCNSRKGVCAKCYGKNMASGNIVKIGEAVGVIAAQSIGEPGTQLTMRTFHTGGVATQGDITGGLLRVEELFEVRPPKGCATIAEINGIVNVDKDARMVYVNGFVPGKAESVTREYAIPYNYNDHAVDELYNKLNGKNIEAGDKIFAGSIYPQDLANLKNITAAQEYIIKEIKETYEAADAEVNEKHIEVIVRQMSRKVRIEKPGVSKFNYGDIVDENDYNDENDRILEETENPELTARGKRILQSITNASITVGSFLSAASFQETARVLADSALKGKVDKLEGLKENIIIGKLIPAGTGTKCYRNVTVVPKEREMSFIKEENLDDKFASEENL